MENIKENKGYSIVGEDDVIDLRQYWLAIMRHKWGILGFAMAATLLAVLFALSLTPIYKATATLLIESEAANIVSIEEVYGIEGAKSEYFETQYEVLKSRRLAEKVVRDLNLVDHAAFNIVKKPILPKELIEKLPFDVPFLSGVEPSELSEDERFRQVVDAFRTSLNIEPVRKTQLVRINYESFDPELAMQVANAVGNAYIENNLEGKLDLTLKASSWLSSRMGSLRSDLTEAERKLQQYREEESIVGERGGLDIASQELELVASKLVDARRQRLEFESLYRQIQAIGKGNPDRLQLVPTVLQHPLVQRMKEEYARVELKRSELAKRYGPKHPTMQAVNSELANAAKALNSQVISVVNGLETNYKVALANERSLESSLKGTKGNIQDLSRKEYRLKELQQEVDAKRTLFDTFLTRFNETSVTGDLKTANARLSDPAVLPEVAVKPRKKLIVAGVFLGALIFGLCFALLLEALNNTLNSARDVETRLSESMLGLLPLLPMRKKSKFKSYLQFIEDPQSSYAESLRTIRTGVILSSLDSDKKTIAITSTKPGEGKTTLALGLSFATGQMERVLLVEADMRRPSIGRALGLTENKNGLSNLVAGTASLDQCIQRYEEGNIDVMTAGMIPPNPSELLSSERFAKVLEVLESKYDRVIIDTAPCQAVSDALILARLVGSMVYIVRADSTTYQNARGGLKRLHEVKAPIIGVVLNQVDVKRNAKYYGDDYGGYYDVYGYATAKS